MLKIKKRVAAVLMSVAMGTTSFPAGNMMIAAEPLQREDGIAQAEDAHDLSGDQLLEDGSETGTWRIEQTDTSIAEEPIVSENGAAEESLVPKDDSPNRVSENVWEAQVNAEALDSTAVQVSGDYEYQVLENGTVAVTKYNGKQPAVTIPSKIGGKDVSVIGRLAFASNEEIETVTIPNTVTKSEYASFISCKNLKKVDFQEGSKLQSLGGATFQSCTDLEDIKLPQSLDVLGEGRIEKNENGIEVLVEQGYVFDHCESLRNIEIPEGVTELKLSLFRECKNLTAVKLPESMEQISSYVFYKCISLRNITIPVNVSRLYPANFERCSNLSEIIVEDGNPNYMFQGGMLFNKAGTEVIYCPEGNKREIQIPTGVKRIGYSAFRLNTSTKISMPEGVEEIDSNAFSGCSKLEGIKIPDSVKTIGGAAFDGCNGLRNISIPGGVENIIYNICPSCEALTEITVEDTNPYYISVDGILYNKDMTKLICCPAGKSGNLTLPSGVSTIDGAFTGCSKLISITLPESIGGMLGNAFSGCSDLTDIYVDEGHPLYSSYEGMLYNKDRSVLVFCPEGKKGSIMIPASVRAGKVMEIPGVGGSVLSYLLDLSGRFMRCAHLTDINVETENPDYVSQEGILYNKEKTILLCCPKAKAGDVIIPERVEEIKERAFAWCDSLRSVAIPAQVEHISDDVFIGCGDRFTLIVAQGSCAEEYAKTHQIKYIYEGEELECFHDLQSVVTKATDKRDGKIVQQCKICQEVTDSVIIPAVKTIRLSKTAYTYNGKVQKPSVIVKDRTGKTLKQGKDHTVYYPKNMKNTGIYMLTVQLKGDYSGKVSRSFTIAPKLVSMSKLTPIHKGFKAVWKKQTSQVTGYEGQFSANKRFTKKATKMFHVDGNKKSSVSVRTGMSKKKYYVRMRAYKTVKKNGKKTKIYSGWSKPKTVITKK